MEAQGAHELPIIIQYLPVHCYILLLVLSSGSKEVTKVLSPNCHNILEFQELWLPFFKLIDTT